MGLEKKVSVFYAVNKSVILPKDLTVFLKEILEPKDFFSFYWVVSLLVVENGLFYKNKKLQKSF